MGPLTVWCTVIGGNMVTYPFRLVRLPLYTITILCKALIFGSVILHVFYHLPTKCLKTKQACFHLMNPTCACSCLCELIISILNYLRQAVLLRLGVHSLKKKLWQQNLHWAHITHLTSNNKICTFCVATVKKQKEKGNTGREKTILLP